MHTLQHHHLSIPYLPSFMLTTNVIALAIFYKEKEMGDTCKQKIRYTDNVLFTCLSFVHVCVT